MLTPMIVLETRHRNSSSEDHEAAHHVVCLLLFIRNGLLLLTSRLLPSTVVSSCEGRFSCQVGHHELAHGFVLDHRFHRVRNRCHTHWILCTFHDLCIYICRHWHWTSFNLDARVEPQHVDWLPMHRGYRNWSWNATASDRGPSCPRYFPGPNRHLYCKSPFKF